MNVAHSRLAAALADRYRIERELGQGGMATVFLAHDVKHDRKVALKVLKPELAAVLGADRFVVEIRTTASLSHPHILPLFDSGTADGFLYYVMPFVQGETLRAKLDRETQLGIDEAVKIATEVADALHYAHQHGVIHRDIKPENILIQNGRPMVADFGIALAVSAAAGGRMTETGLSLGTPHYMSPEQATAEKEITGRSDIYSLASVLYEMLTGEPPHMGNSAQQIVMKIIADTPRPVTDLRKSVPVHVANAVAQALEKLPADRFASAADFVAALEGRVSTRGHALTGSSSAPGAPWRQIAIGAVTAAVLFAALAGVTWVGRDRPAADLEPVRFALRMGTGISERTRVTISPDGRRILQSVLDSAGVFRLQLRELGSTDVATIPGSEGATDPSYSPDGEWIVYLSTEGKLSKMRAAGGPAIALVDSATAGSHWTDDGWILYTRSGDGLWRVRDSGGAPERLTSLDTAGTEFNHWYPQGLPGGRAAIFNSFQTPLGRIEAVEYSSGRRTVLVEGAVFPRYVASGHLLYAKDGAIFAMPFDPKGLRALGPAVPVVDDLAWTATDGTAGFEVAANGTLVYLKASDWRVDRRVVWVDRAGNERPALPETGPWAEPRLSADGRWIALTRLLPTWQIWLVDRARQVQTQLTRDKGVAFNPVWMPDSRSLLYSTETPVYDLHRISIDGSSNDTVVVSRFDKQATSVSPDGRLVAYHETVDRDRLMVSPIAGGAATPVDEREFSQRNGVYSPDGRWFAYEEFPSRSSGQSQIYLRATGGTAGRRQISADGGSQPRWTRGGRELVYRRGDRVFAVTFDPSTGEAGSPVLLFRKPDAGRIGGGRTTGYDVTPDGTQFLMVVPVERPEALPTVVVLNWFQELRRKAPR